MFGFNALVCASVALYSAGAFVLQDRHELNDRPIIGTYSLHMTGSRKKHFVSFLYFFSLAAYHDFKFIRFYNECART